MCTIFRPIRLIWEQFKAYSIFFSVSFQIQFKSIFDPDLWKPWAIFLDFAVTAFKNENCWKFFGVFLWGSLPRFGSSLIWFLFPFLGPLNLELDTLWFRIFHGLDYCERFVSRIAKNLFMLCDCVWYNTYFTSFRAGLWPEDFYGNILSPTLIHDKIPAKSKQNPDIQETSYWGKKIGYFSKAPPKTIKLPISWLSKKTQFL